MVVRRVLLVVAGAVLVAGCSSAPTRTMSHVSDGILVMKIPHGWHTSVSFGHSGVKTAAYILIGNFRFRHRPNEEAGPSVPTRRVLVNIGDFPILGNYGRGWRRVDRLRLPSAHKWTFTWHVRFLGRALYLGVEFGSRPTAHLRRLVNRRLASVRRID